MSFVIVRIPVPVFNGFTMGIDDLWDTILCESFCLELVAQQIDPIHQVIYAQVPDLSVVAYCHLMSETSQSQRSI